MGFRKPLPVQASGALSTAEALRIGVTPAQLRNPELTRPFHGVRVPTIGHDPSGSIALARAYLPRLPLGSVFSHWTAAVIWGLPLPDGMRAGPIHVATPPPGRERRGRGVVGHRMSLPPDTTTERYGLPVTTPARTWCDLGRYLDVRGLVAAGDRLLWFQDPLSTDADLRAAIGRVRAGAPALRVALPLLSDRSQSQRESQLRMLIVASGFGFPTPSPNYDVILAANGRRVRLDIAFPEQRLGLEYEGDHHRTDRSQWRSDIRRIDDLEASGWRLMRITDDDLRDEQALLIRVADRLRSLGWVPPSDRSPRMAAGTRSGRQTGANRR